MPDFSGIELCQKVRASGETSCTYIIIGSKISEKNKAVKGLSAGADDYLTKPFDSDEFLARVRVGQHLLDLHRQQLASDSLPPAPPSTSRPALAVRGFADKAKILLDLTG